MSTHPNVNIIETSVVVEDSRISVLLAVDGVLFHGDGSELTDQVHILLALKKEGYLR